MDIYLETENYILYKREWLLFICPRQMRKVRLKDKHKYSPHTFRI